MGLKGFRLGVVEIRVGSGFRNPGSGTHTSSWDYFMSAGLRRSSSTAFFSCRRHNVFHRIWGGSWLNIHNAVCRAIAARASLTQKPWAQTPKKHWVKGVGFI